MKSIAACSKCVVPKCDYFFIYTKVWDVTMQDLCSGSLTLDPFKAVVFVGGFSYADVLGSAKGRTHSFLSLPFEKLFLQ